MRPDSNDLLTNLLYFYSTVPQVLGAILAISGAFVVFNLQRLRKGFYGTTQILYDRRKKGLSEDGVYRKVFTDQDIETFREAQVMQNANAIMAIIARSRIRIDAQEDERLTNHITLISERNDGINTFISNSRKTYYVNGALLLTFLAVFFIIPYVHFSCVGYWITLIAGFLLTAFSLGWIVLFLIKSLY